MKGRFLALVFLGVFAASVPVHAALILTIDPITKEFWLTGTATGTTSSLGRTVWSNGNSSSGDIAGANFSVITTSPLLNPWSIRITSSTGSGSTFGIFFNETSRSTTITGAGSAQKVYYGGMTSTSITRFESGIGQNLNNTESGSTSFGTLTVVPEPSVASLLMIGIGGVMAMRRRRA